MQGRRFGLQRHFIKKYVDIINHADFPSSKKAFKSMMVVLKKEGKANVRHKSSITSDEDMQLIQESFDLSSPQGLQDKVFIDVMMYFCNQGWENLQAMTADHFEEHVRSDGLTFITLKDMLTKK